MEAWRRVSTGRVAGGVRGAVYRSVAVAGLTGLGQPGRKLPYNTTTTTAATATTAAAAATHATHAHSCTRVTVVTPPRVT